MDIGNKLRLPEAKGLLGVGVPMVVDLPSTQLHLRADMLRDVGTGRRPGRPSKDDPEAGEVQRVEVTLMLFDEMLPAPYSLARDLRVQALGQAQLADDKQKTAVEGVNVLHMHSGEQQLFRPQLKRQGFLSAAELGEVPAGTLVRVAGIVIIRQRPGTARGFLFLTLEDETGFINVVVKPDRAERFRREVTHVAALAVTGTVERAKGVINVRGETFAPLRPEPLPVGLHSRDFR